MDERHAPASTILYRHLRKTYGARHEPQENSAKTHAYGSGRDPETIADAVQQVSTQLGWDTPLTQGKVLADWPEIVGPSLAEHTQPLFDGSTLVIRCSSTAWASTLTFMRAKIADLLAQRYPEIHVEEIICRGPDAPSWKKGRRSIPGRGPRDTYG